MRVLLLGATGRSGRHLLTQSLERGHDVNVIVRDKRKLTVSEHDHLKVFEGDVCDKELLGTALADCDAVMSCLNISRTSDFPWARLRTPEHFLENMLKNLIPLMEDYAVQRIIITSAWGVGDSRSEIPGWFKWFIDHSNVGKAYAQHEIQENMLRQSSLDWTAIRPVGLTNGNKIKTLLVSKEGNPKPGLLISRRHTAKFMLDILEKEAYVKETPVISEK